MENNCPQCESKNIIKRGVRKTKYRGEIQRFGCVDCGKRFVSNEGFFKMKNHEDKITSCMNMYYSGMSLRKIQSHLQMFAPKNSHYSTIYRWLVKYATMISATTDNFQINSGIEIMSDEMEYYRRISSNKIGREQNWFVDTLDLKSRFMITGEYMKSRTNENLIGVLKRTKFKTGDEVKIVTTDGLRGYPEVLKKSFGLQSFHHATSRTRSKIIHNVVIANERGFNHPIERLHNSIRERTKVMRGFHGSISSAKAIMKGYEIYYNFIRKHQAIKCCPYELAIPSLKLGNNRWLDLIKLSA